LAIVILLFDNRTSRVEGFGGATPPQNLPLLACCGGKAAAAGKKIKAFGGLLALQTSQRNVRWWD
jgi:hypothetical protein